MKTNSERVVERYGKLVWRICYVKLAPSDLSSVEDAFQDVFLTYMERPPEADPDTPEERAWFVKCAVNRCTDHFRRIIRRGEAELDELIPAHDDGHNEALDVLLTLPEKYRMPMYLHYVAGYDTTECAKLLGIGGSALRMRLSRGRTLFAKALGYEESDMGERKPI